MFPERASGVGREYVFEGLLDQPTTHALVLSSEAMRYAVAPNKESRRRVLHDAVWLLRHQDDDHDGGPGWGFPFPWDAFADGTQNPANQAYAVDTAFAMQGLQDALEFAPSVVAPFRLEVEGLLIRTADYWCSRAWSSTKSGGFFWYSANSNDAIFVPNSSAILAGMVARLARGSHGGEAHSHERWRTCAEDAIRQLVASARPGPRGSVEWPYQERAPAVPNDLTHQIYTLWGVELVRDLLQSPVIPWSRGSVASQSRLYTEDSVVRAYPRETSFPDRFRRLGTRGADLWGVGMLVAWEARYGSRKEAKRLWTILDVGYGPTPHLRSLPHGLPQSRGFIARHAVHALYGLAWLEYGRNAARSLGTGA
jgi:hypothetical protein